MLRSYGEQGLQAYIRQHLEWAQELHQRIEADERLEPICETPFALVCFRHVNGDHATEALAKRINDSGNSYVTPSVVNEQAFIRVSIGSTWTEKRHVDTLWELIDNSAEPI